MRRSLAARVLIAALVLASFPRPAHAAALHALPATVRVNVTPNGVGYTVVASTGSVTATGPDGHVLYQGSQRLLVRTNVRRAEGVSLTLPPPRASLTPDERVARRELVREARRAELEARSSAAIITIPFEVSLIRDPDDALGSPLLSEQKPVVITFATRDGVLTVNGRGFRGTLETTTDDEGLAIVVNTVETGAYLASVVGSEEPSTWEPEALAAQAIAARTYLATHLRRHDHYDLEGDTRDQEYDGVGNEVRSTLRAVERTAGVIATYRGAAIEALYSANAGGVTEDSENVFANALPYLRSVPSPTDDIAANSSFGRTAWSWDREISAPQLGDYLRVRGVDVGIPQRIDLVQVTPSGRVTLARVVGTRGTKDLGKDVTRYYFGLRSTMFTVVLHPSNELEWVSVRDTARLRDMDILGASKMKTRYEHTMDADGRRIGLEAMEYLFAIPARFEFIGKGFGHGVGMSQWGAQGMALQGASYEQILKHYYTGIELTNVGGA